MGALADRFRIKKILFLTFQIITAVALFPICFIPKLPNVRFACEDGGAVLDTSPVNFGTHPTQIIPQLVHEKGENGTISCNIQCPMNSTNEDWATIHNFWSGLKSLPRESQFTFTAKLAVARADVLDDVFLYFPVHEVEVSGIKSRAVCPNRTYSLSHVCEMSCDSKVLRNLLESRKESVADVAGFYQFWLFFILAIFAWVGMAVVVSIGDAICFEILGKNSN